MAGLITQNIVINITRCVSLVVVFGGEESTLIFWAEVSSVTQEPLAFTTPRSAPILLP